MKSVLILGALSDIAQATAHRFAQAGHHIIFAARRIERLDAIVRDFEIRYKDKPEAVAFDALDCDGHRHFYEVLSTKPDVTICVFGALGDQKEEEKDFSKARCILDTNYSGAVSILHVVAADYEMRKAGVIIGVSSVAGERGRQSNYIYGGAKAGVTAFLSGLRNRLYPSGVHVMTVKPGFVRTAMTEGVKLPPLITATPEQVAADIYKAYEKKRDVVYTLWVWRYIMLIIRVIPEFVFKRLKM